MADDRISDLLVVLSQQNQLNYFWERFNAVEYSFEDLRMWSGLYDQNRPAKKPSQRHIRTRTYLA